MKCLIVGSNLSVQTGEDVMFNCNTRNLGT